MMKSTHFKISYNIYPFDLFVSFGETDQQLKRFLERYGVKYEKELTLQNKCTLARTVMGKDGATVIRMRTIPKHPVDKGVLAHEIFHAIEFLMHKVGIPLSKKSSEAYAYLIGYVTEEIYKRI
jgi:hypothetical protein